MQIEAEDLINRWVFFPQDFALSDPDPLLDITRSFQFQAEKPSNRRFESANLSKLMEPYPDEVHRLGEIKAAAKLERYKAQGRVDPYTYQGFLECQATDITSISVSSTTLKLIPDPIEGNPAHIAIEMVSAEGAHDNKNVRIAIKDKLSAAFGNMIIGPQRKI